MSNPNALSATPVEPTPDPGYASPEVHSGVTLQSVMHQLKVWQKYHGLRDFKVGFLVKDQHDYHQMYSRIMYEASPFEVQHPIDGDLEIVGIPLAIVSEK